MRSLFLILLCSSQAWARDDAASVASEAARWRSQHRLIDLHQHISCLPEHLQRAVRVMDAAGIGTVVNLSGGPVTHSPGGGPSEFERNKTASDRLAPGRFLLYMNLDYDGWDLPGFSDRAVRQIEEGYRLGAAGLKEFKRLGLYLRDSAGKLIRVDDPRLDPVWKRCGELNMPVSIHAADPKAFWLPYDSTNERWKELKDHPAWWFGDTNKYPGWKELLTSLNRVIARHPKTTFVCVHFANNAEELDWVDESLSRYPNMMADLAARIPEIGRHAPRKVRELFLRHQDRILFATDFQVYDKLILGSSGNERPPTDADAEVFFAKEYRWLETNDQNWPHMTPIQGDWKISSIGLPSSVLRKIYFDNASRLLARSLPTPILQARRISQDLEMELSSVDSPLWATAKPVFLERQAVDGAAVPSLASTVRALWSTTALYLKFECPYTRITAFPSSSAATERAHPSAPGQSLWDRDVVEAFVAPDPSKPGRYGEFEVSPSNERLDVLVDPAEKQFSWDSGFQSSVRFHKDPRQWECTMRIPFVGLSAEAPKNGHPWRLNLYRCDRENRAFLAWNPPLTGSFHTPNRFGVLEFTE